MRTHRLARLWPRRLRWRLVLSFALTVALLQAVLTGAERLLLQRALVQSIQQGLQDTVNAGLAGPLFAQALQKDLASWSGTAGAYRQGVAALQEAQNAFTSPNLRVGSTRGFADLQQAQQHFAAMTGTSPEFKSGFKFLQEARLAFGANDPKRGLKEGFAELQQAQQAFASWDAKAGWDAKRGFTQELQPGHNAREFKLGVLALQSAQQDFASWDGKAGFGQGLLALQEAQQDFAAVAGTNEGFKQGFASLQVAQQLFASSDGTVASLEQGLAALKAAQKALTAAGGSAGADQSDAWLLDLFTAADAARRLPDLTSSLALPDQPVAMLDTNGHVLAQTASLAGDRKRAQPLAPAVMSSLLGVATLHTATPAGTWTGQVPTPDGPYFLLLQPAGTPVLDPVLTKQDASVPLAVAKAGPKVLGDPAARAALKSLNGRTSGLVVMIGRRLGDTQQTVQTVTAISIGGALAVIVLAALLSLLVVGRALRPLGAITRGAERLAQGEYGYRLVLDTGADEVGRLATAFNRMAAAIGTAFATQRRFVADASHELRTPLTALRGYTDVLLMGVDEDRATGERVLRAMQEDLGRMSRLVNDLLTLARLDGGATLQLAPLALADLLGAAAYEGQAIAQGRQEIIADAVPREVVIWGDRDRLRQVLSNIVANACAYCPLGSVIHLRAALYGHWAAITVQDNGPGIPAHELARLGERFYRGDTARSRRTGGTGLGLAIARAIVEAHGGALSIDSTVGVGTLITIRLPLVPPTAAGAGGSAIHDRPV